MTNDSARLVHEFYTAAGIEHPADTHIKLIEEELAEVREAAAHLLKELCDLEYVAAGAFNSGIIALPDELADKLNSIMPHITAFTDDTLEEAFRRVHQSNMSKLTDGVLLRDPETGKILKGPNYKKPDLSDLI